MRLKNGKDVMLALHRLRGDASLLLHVTNTAAEGTREDRTLEAELIMAISAFDRARVLVGVQK